MKVYPKKDPDVISFAEARELDVPADVIEFAAGTQHRAPMAIEGLRRDQAVRQYMQRHNVQDYYQAFQIVALGHDPRDVFADDSNNPARRRSEEVADRLARAFAGTRAVRDVE